MENTHIKTEETPVTSNSETATVAASTDNSNNVVTSSSPTPTSSAFQPFQQLHEAVLAAVNSHNMPLSHQSFMEAVAAATNSVNSQAQQAQQQQQQQQQPQQQQPPQPMTDAEYAKKESIRASNRERKKKWRIHNEERNKDNDLRCRVNKRANKLFGLAESPTKTAWVQDEFEKRRQKRMDKERRKLIVNNVLSVPGSDNSHNVAMPNIVSNGQMPTFYTPLPQIDTATAAKLLDFPTDLQRQLLEQLNNSMMALTNGIQQTASESEDNKTQMVDQAMHDLVESAHAESSNSNTTTQTVTTSAEIPTATMAAVTADNMTTNLTGTPPTTATTPVPIVTEAAAAAVSQSEPTTSLEATPSSTIATPPTTTATTAATTTTTTTTTQEPQTTATNTGHSSNTSDSSSGHNSPLQYPATTTTTATNEETPQNETVKNEDGKEEGKEEKKQEYPMDAVLTLMQLNAGWRQ